MERVSDFRRTIQTCLHSDLHNICSFCKRKEELNIHDQKDALGERPKGVVNRPLHRAHPRRHSCSRKARPSETYRAARCTAGDGRGPTGRVGAEGVSGDPKKIPKEMK